MDEVKLLPCPFCGGEAIYCHVKRLSDPYYHAFKAQCSKCGAENRFKCDTKEEAADAWNKRYNGSV